MGKPHLITNVSRKEIKENALHIDQRYYKRRKDPDVHQALWGACGIDCEFCSGCDNRGGGRTESIYQPYIDGIKEIREINEEFRAPFVRG